MTRAVTEEEFELSKSDFVKSAGQQTVLIKRDGETVAVLTSPEQYETTREAKADAFDCDSRRAFRVGESS